MKPNSRWPPSSATRAMPEDKLTWEVEGKGRSALEQPQECAMSAAFFASILEQTELEPDFFDKARQTYRTWTTIDACEQHAKANTERLFAAIRNVPDDALHNEVELPGTNGQTDTNFNVVSFQNWHFTYHNGQISFIETLYGDKESH